MLLRKTPCVEKYCNEKSWAIILLNQNKKYENPKHLSPLTLAFLGDAVFELLVREELVSQANAPVGKLHKKAVGIVCAGAQSNAVTLLEPVLTAEETEIYKRGRNTNGHHVPKNADPASYRRATGLEALFGYLYLQGKTERILELFNMIQHETAENSEH